MGEETLEETGAAADAAVLLELRGLARALAKELVLPVGERRAGPLDARARLADVLAVIGAVIAEANAVAIAGALVVDRGDLEGSAANAARRATRPARTPVLRLPAADAAATRANDVAVAAVGLQGAAIPTANLSSRSSSRKRPRPIVRSPRG
jgi:hypothetical protein